MLGGCKLIENLQEPISYEALNPPDETIPLPPTSQSCDNEPAGWTRAISSGMDQLPSRSPSYSADGFTFFENQARTLFIEQSSSAPASPGSVLRVVFPEGGRGAIRHRAGVPARCRPTPGTSTPASGSASCPAGPPTATSERSSSS